MEYGYKYKNSDLDDFLKANNNTDKNIKKFIKQFLKANNIYYPHDESASRKFNKLDNNDVENIKKNLIIKSNLNMEDKVDMFNTLHDNSIEEVLMYLVFNDKYNEMNFNINGIHRLNINYFVPSNKLIELMISNHAITKFIMDFDFNAFTFMKFTNRLTSILREMYNNDETKISVMLNKLSKDNKYINQYYNPFMYFISILNALVTKKYALSDSSLYNVFDIYHSNYLCKLSKYDTGFVNAFRSLSLHSDHSKLRKLIKDDDILNIIDYYTLFKDCDIPDDLLKSFMKISWDNKHSKNVDLLISSKANMFTDDMYYIILRYYKNLTHLDDLADYYIYEYLYKISYFIKDEVLINVIKDEVNDIDKYLKEILSNNEIDNKPFIINGLQIDFETKLNRLLILCNLKNIQYKIDNELSRKLFDIAFTIDKYKIVKDSSFNPVILLQITNEKDQDLIKKATDWYVDNNILNNNLRDILIDKCNISKNWMLRESLEKLTDYYSKMSNVEVYDYLVKLNKTINARNFEYLIDKKLDSPVFITIYIYVTNSVELINKYFDKYETFKRYADYILPLLNIDYSKLDEVYYNKGKGIIPKKFMVRNLIQEEHDSYDSSIEFKNDMSIRVINYAQKDTDEVRKEASLLIKKKRGNNYEKSN